MRKISIGLVLSLVAVMAFTFAAVDAGAADTIKIGFNIPLTGDNPDVGASSKNAAEMYLKKNPMVDVGGKSYSLKFVYDDNEYKAESAVKVSTKLITEEGVLGIIGPQSSSQAVPAGEVANNYATPMISPWSTNPNTTLDRPFVFRGCFLDPFQGPVAANFATDELGAKKAAVLYDIAADYPKGLAEFFKAAFEEDPRARFRCGLRKLYHRRQGFFRPDDQHHDGRCRCAFYPPVLQRSSPDRACRQRDGLDQADPRVRLLGRRGPDGAVR
jgi:branched-chain amino acid transport system substrate-binding protein